MAISSETGAILIGAKEFVKQLKNMDIISTRGMSDVVHEQAERFASGLRRHSFARSHKGFSRSIEAGRLGKKSRKIGSFVRVDYDIAVENVKSDWPGKRWLPLVWEYGNHRMAGNRMVTNTWLSMRKSFIPHIKRGANRVLIARAKWMRQQVKNKTKGLS